MLLAAVAVPLVLPCELLGSIELAEAVSDGDTMRQVLESLHAAFLVGYGLRHLERLLHMQLLEERLLLVLGSIQ